MLPGKRDDFSMTGGKNLDRRERLKSFHDFEVTLGIFLPFWQKRIHNVLPRIKRLNRSHKIYREKIFFYLSAVLGGRKLCRDAPFKRRNTRRTNEEKVVKNDHLFFFPRSRILKSFSKLLAH
jgi:hypothetical protein